MVYPFLAVFARGLGVDLSTISLLLTGRSVITAIGPLIASIADNRGRKTGILLGTALFTIGTAPVIINPNIFTFAFAVLLIALGKSVFDPSVHAYLGDQVKYQQRGLATAVFETSWSLSFIFGIPLVGLMIARWNWRAPFPVLFLLGVFIFFVFSRLLPNQPVSNTSLSAIQQNFRAVMSTPTAQAGLALSFLISSANEMINLVFGVWMENSFGLHIAALGAASAVIGVSELSGEGLVGLLTDRIGKPNAIAAGLIVNSLAALAISLHGNTVNGALAGLFLFYISFEFVMVSSIPLMTEVLPSARATLMALNIAAISLGRGIGAFLAPPVFRYGILANSAGAILLNLLALYALFHLIRLLNKTEHISEAHRSTPL